jgi:PAS domain S-box-containing protein
MKRGRRHIPAADGRFMARALGGVFVAAAALALVWLVLPNHPVTNHLAIAIVAASAAAIGALLLSGRLDRQPLWVFEAAVAAATVLASFANYYAGVPGSGFGYLYLWATPYAYWFFPRPRALLQTMLVVVCFAIASVAQSAAHPALAGATGINAGRVLLQAGTLIVIGELVRTLSRHVREGHLRFLRIFEDAPIGMARVSLDGRYLEVNPAFCAAVGWTSEQLVGRPIGEIVPPEDVAALESARDDLISGRAASRQIERDYVRPDGSRATGLVSIVLVDTPTGREFVMQTVDLTARRQAEAETRTLVELTDQAGDFIGIAELDGRFRYLNEAGRRMVGASNEADVRDLRILDYLTGEARELFIRSENPALLERGEWRGETRVRNLRSGEELDVELNSFVIRAAEDGRPTAIGIVQRDITARKRTERELLASDLALRRSEARLQAIVQHAPAAIFIVDPAGRITLVNGETARLVGRDRTELLGATYDEIFPPAVAERLAQRDREVLQRGEPELTQEALPAAEDERFYLVATFPIPGAETDGPSICHISFDVTDRERARRALALGNEQRRRLLAQLVRVQEEERRRIAADVHDDSIQVMTGAAIRLELLADQLESPEQRRLVDALDSSVRSSIRSLRRLLFELRPPALDEHGLAAAIRTYLAETLEQEGVVHRVEDRLDAEPPPELRALLYRVAQEALANVRRHARAHRVEVTLWQSGGAFVVRVQDDGVGFDPAELRGDRPGHLGMVAMRERVESADGRLRVESSPGRGTTIEFEVPAVAHPAQAVAR